MKQIIKYSFILILIDQIIKLIISANLYETINIINNFFSLTYVKNTGAAFSILEGQRLLFIIIALAAIYIIYKYLIKDKKLDKLNKITYILIIGGIIGNLIDRVIYGYVIDYLEFKIFNTYMPIFNFADILITLGAILFVISILKEEKYERIHS